MNRVESTMSCIGGTLFYSPIPMDRINPNGSNPNPNPNQSSMSVKDGESSKIMPKGVAHSQGEGMFPTVKSCPRVLHKGDVSDRVQ